MRRARIPRQVDADGPNWTGRQVAESFRCCTWTVENVRKRCVLKGFPLALEGRQRQAAQVPKLLDREPEARVIATRLGPPPKDFGLDTTDLLFFRFRSDGRILKAVVEKSGPRNSRLVTFYRATKGGVESSLERGEVIIDQRSP